MPKLKKGGKIFQVISMLVSLLLTQCFLQNGKKNISKDAFLSPLFFHELSCDFTLPLLFSHSVCLSLCDPVDCCQDRVLGRFVTCVWKWHHVAFAIVYSLMHHWVQPLSRGERVWRRQGSRDCPWPSNIRQLCVKIFPSISNRQQKVKERKERKWSRSVVSDSATPWTVAH